MFSRYAKFFSANQQGVSLVEAAITLPFVAILVYGLIDFGFALRQVQVVDDAARYAAQTAFSEDQIMLGEQGLPCKTDIGKSKSLLTLSCTEIEKMEPQARLDYLGKNSACRYLKNSGLNPDLWNISPTFDRLQTFDSKGNTLEVTTVKISIDRDPQHPLCLLCLDFWKSPHGNHTIGHAESIFRLDPYKEHKSCS